jgi:hypothetical protein
MRNFVAVLVSQGSDQHRILLRSTGRPILAIQSDRKRTALCASSHMSTLSFSPVARVCIGIQGASNGSRYGKKIQPGRLVGRRLRDLYVGESVP